MDSEVDALYTSILPYLHHCLCLCIGTFIFHTSSNNTKQHGVCRCAGERQRFWITAYVSEFLRLGKERLHVTCLL